MPGLSETGYETWKHPSLPLTIRYPLPLFHEMDFLVGEGYRRIPFGGIEHGGLLFGRKLGQEFQVEAFRQIECEHATGPGFQLSDRDRTSLREQIQSAQTDTALSGMELLGLFVSHSRHELEITEAERELTGLLFPQCAGLVVMLKPEKFKPTRFVAGIRNEDGSWEADAAAATFTLPLPGRTNRMRKPPERSESGGADSTPAVSAEPDQKVSKASPRGSRRKLTVFQLDQAPAAPTVGTPAAVPVTEDLPGLALETGSPDARHRPKRWMLTGFALISFAAIALCFTWFDWNYLEPPVDLHASSAAGGLTIRWAPGETAGTNEAKLRLWTSQGQRVVALSTAQKRMGQATVPIIGNDMTVELTAHQWGHDRRGLVRLILKPNRPSR